MDELDWTLFEGLVDQPGLPGRERRVAEWIIDHLPASGWEVSRDPIGNLAVRRPGPGPRVMLAAHMDEVGLIVQRITPEGFLRVERLGGMAVGALPGSRLHLWMATGSLPAQVGVLPHHLDNHRAPELAELYVDIGAGSRTEAEAMGAQVGDGLTWDSPLRALGPDRLAGKAFDDRAGCFVLLSLAWRLSERPPACDLTLAFIVQEETQLTGGAPLVNGLAPEVVIGVDGTLAFDTPDLAGQQSEIVLGGGPTLKWTDAIRGRGVTFVPDWELNDGLRTFARRMEIPLQAEVITGLTTAVSPLAHAGIGVRTAALSIPIRYHHTPVETLDRRDVSRLVRLLEAALREAALFQRK